MKDNTHSFTTRICKLRRHGETNEATKVASVGERDTSLFRRSQVAFGVDCITGILKPTFPGLGW